jgi:hypothetical protein
MKSQVVVLNQGLINSHHHVRSLLMTRLFLKAVKTVTLKGFFSESYLSVRSHLDNGSNRQLSEGNHIHLIQSQ